MGLGRLEMFARLGRISTAETLFAQASQRAEEQKWRTRLERAPHGEPWHSSFHVSQLPAGDERACARKALYEMMAFPPEQPASRMLMGTAIVGQAAEDWNIVNLDLDGRLLSAGAKEEFQTGFIDADHWLTGSPDFIVLPPGWNRPHLIETKTKDLEIVVDMKNLNRSYDAQHARQARGYIGLGHHITPQLWPSVWICKQTWRLALCMNHDDGSTTRWCRDHEDGLECLMELQLEPLRSGSLIYMGRNRPHITCEYVFEHDEQWFQRGLAVLAKWKQNFINDELPGHPFGGKDWSKRPCQYCDFKKSTCKPDHQAGITKLSESNGIAWAQEVYGSYDVDSVMKAVLDRWRGRTGFSAKSLTQAAGSADTDSSSGRVSLALAQ